MKITRWLAAITVLVTSTLLAQSMTLTPSLQTSAGGAATKKKRPPPLAMGAAFSPSGELWLVALNAEQQLFVQTSVDAGRTWSAQRVVATGSDKISADGENRPKLAFGPKGYVIITYTEPLAKPYTGQIRMLRSDDSGRTFAAPVTVHQDRQQITHRFESVAFDSKGTLHTFWIDKRDLEAQITAATAAAAAATAAATAPPAMSGASATPTAAPAAGGRKARIKTDYRGAAVYRNESTDGGKTFGPDIKLADHSCECCRIALAPTPDGSMAALWRHVFAPNERDHAFMTLTQKARSEPTRATFDHWAIDACPHHGPGLAPAAGGGYHAVWFGIRAGEGRARYSQLDASGAPRGDVVALPDERAEHAVVQSIGERVVIVWRGFDGEKTRLRAWLSKDNGRTFALKELARSSDDNDHPLLLVRNDTFFALWRTTEGVRVETIAP